MRGWRPRRVATAPPPRASKYIGEGAAARNLGTPKVFEGYLADLDKAHLGRGKDEGNIADFHQIDCAAGVELKSGAEFDRPAAAPRNAHSARAPQDSGRERAHDRERDESLDDVARVS